MRYAPLLLLAALLATTAIHAQPWEPVHTFTNNTYRLLCCAPDQQICLSTDFAVATSSNLTQWTEHGLAQLPASLYETEEYRVDLIPLHVVALPESGFLMVLLKVESPQLGNFRIRTLYSVRSTNGLHWSDTALVASLYDALNDSFLRQVGSQLLFTYADYPSGNVIGTIQSQCRFYIYAAQPNTWSFTWQTNASPNHCHLFSDAASFYFVHWQDPGPVIGGDDRTHIESSPDGLVWQPLPSLETYLSAADAHDQLIFGAESHYSPGAGWQPTTHAPLRNIRFNGDTAVGSMSNDLVVSRDFGVSWSHQSFTELEAVDFASHGSSYVALVTARQRSGDPLVPDTIRTSLLQVAARTARSGHTNSLHLTVDSGNLAFNSQSNVVYQTETTRDLASARWTAYGLPLLGESALSQVPIRPNANSPAFFRVVARPPSSP
jgi:hypothetical protein